MWTFVSYVICVTLRLLIEERRHSSDALNSVKADATKASPTTSPFFTFLTINYTMPTIFLQNMDLNFQLFCLHN